MEEQPPLKSKSQLKREADAAQDLGEALIALKPQQLAQIPLPEDLKGAVTAAQQIRSHGALRRQRQYIGRLMRDIDTTPIRTALDALQRTGRAQADELHVIERWRDALTAGDETTLQRALGSLPAAEAGQLRQLVQESRQEQQSGHHKGAGRRLFRYLRDIGAAAVAPSTLDNP